MQKRVMKLVPSFILGCVCVVVFFFIPPNDPWLWIMFPCLLSLTAFMFLAPIAGKKTALVAGLFVISFFVMTMSIRFDLLNTILLLAFVVGFRLLIQ